MVSNVIINGHLLSINCSNCRNSSPDIESLGYKIGLNWSEMNRVNVSSID